MSAAATTLPDSGYYAPLDIKHIHRPFPAWTIYTGTTPNGEWVNEYHSMASARPQRRYFQTEELALDDVKEFSR